MAAAGTMHVNGRRRRRVKMRTAPGRPMPMMVIVNHATTRKRSQHTRCKDGCESRDPA
jgi:hypothetical protein